jgi:hypothetical protein
LLIPRLSGLAHALQPYFVVRRLWTILLISALSLSGVAVAADALVTSQREELDGFLDDVTREKLDARVDGALAHLNPGAVTVRLQVEGRAQRFEAGESGELSESLRQALGVFDSGEQKLLQHSVNVDAERATVTTRIGDASYEQTVIYDLVRRDERWLIRSLRVL